MKLDEARAVVDMLSRLARSSGLEWDHFESELTPGASDVGRPYFSAVLFTGKSGLGQAEIRVVFLEDQVFVFFAAMNGGDEIFFQIAQGPSSDLSLVFEDAIDLVTEQTNVAFVHMDRVDCPICGGGDV